MKTELIIIIVKHDGVVELSDKLIDSFKIQENDFRVNRFLYSDKTISSEEFDSTVTDKEILLINDFKGGQSETDFFSQVFRKIETYVYTFNLVNVWFHQSNNEKGEQKKIFDEHFNELKYNWEQGSHSPHNIYGKKDLIALLNVENQTDWDTVFQKMSNCFFDNVLEDKIINLINDSKEDNLSAFRNYTKNNNA